MTRENALLINAIREVCGQAPIPEKGRVKGGMIRQDPDRRHVAYLAQFIGDGNRQASKKAGAL